MRCMRVLVLALASFVFSASAAAENLVDVHWLAKSLESPGVLVLDASPGPLHAKAHIPGAIPVDVFAVASFGLRNVPVEQMEHTYQSLGIDPGKRLVIYDQGGTWFAPRLFFQLRYHGFPLENLVILDGGMAKWQAEGLPVTKEPTPTPAAGSFRIAKVDEQARSSTADLVAASGDRANHVLLDALGPGYYYGADAFFDKAGHIPGAVLMPAEDFFNADKTYKSPEEIRRMLAHLSIRPDQEIHAHCGGGGAASVPYFALRHLAGYPKVRLSIESQMGWLRDERDLPFWTYAAPAMMRDAGWLQAWGGRRMRAFGVSRVSVVDVRTPAAYARGHVPFALSVPGDTFRNHGKRAGELADLLGSAGVDPSHEAVIVSGGGVTRDAALAYVLLEKLGQKRISVFVDSLDSADTLGALARGGLALTKDATIVGPPSPGDLAVSPAKYEADPREGVTLADARAGSGAYPRVYIASGPALPARTPDGKVVHVPYTTLLKADGTPKAAKDIWAVLAKAGVPRYSELVTFSEEPGEAAVTYFVFKLMGLPDVKVMM